MESAVLRLAQEHTTADGFEEGILGLFEQTVGFDAAFFSVPGEKTAPTSSGIEHAVAERAVRHAARYSAELLPVKQAALRARGVAVDTRIIGEAAVRRTAYYREMARTVAGRHSLLAYVPLRGRTVALLMLGRSGSPFTDHDIAAVESALPEIGVARGSYGLPILAGPLRAARDRGLLGRLAPSLRRRPLDWKVAGKTAIEVRERRGFREMVAHEQGTETVWTRASIAAPNESGWPYVELFHLAALQARGRRRALFIGCGGGVAPRQFASAYPGIALDVVEREPSVVDLACDWFGLDQIPGLQVHLGDGAAFVKSAPEARWDVAVVDAFDAAQLAPGIRDASFFAALHRTLRSGGTVAVNVIGTLDGGGPVREVTSWLERHFHRLRVVPVMVPHEQYLPSAVRNVVVVASKR